MLLAVESRNGWLKLSDKKNGNAGGGWIKSTLNSNSGDVSLSGVVNGVTSFNPSSSYKNMLNTKNTPNIPTSPNNLKANKKNRKSVFQGAMDTIRSAKSNKNVLNGTIGDNDDDDVDNPLLSSYEMPTVRLLTNDNEDDEKDNERRLSLTKSQKRKSIVNFVGFNSTDQKETSSSSEYHGSSATWHMPKKVAVVRVSNDKSLISTHNDKSKHKHGFFHHSKTKKAKGASAEEEGSETTTGVLHVPPPPSSLPAVFAIYHDDNNNNNEIESGQDNRSSEGNGGTHTGINIVNKNTDGVLSDLVPLDMPLPPQPCPAALSLMDLDQLPHGIR